MYIYIYIYIYIYMLSPMPYLLNSQYQTFTYRQFCENHIINARVVWKLRGNSIDQHHCYFNRCCIKFGHAQ